MDIHNKIICYRYALDGIRTNELWALLEIKSFEVQGKFLEDDFPEFQAILPHDPDSWIFEMLGMAEEDEGDFDDYVSKLWVVITELKKQADKQLRLF